MQENLFNSTVRPPVTIHRGWAASLPYSMVHGSIPWSQYSGSMYGKEYERPRLECWYNDDLDRGYAFGGGDPVMPIVMDQVVARVRLRLAQQDHGWFDSCFANLYEHGRHSISWHADDDDWIGPVIASVSFGATRRFRMKPKLGPGEPVYYDLEHGDLLVMHAGCQASWVHCVPKTTREVLPRVNLTYRTTRSAA